MKKVIHADLPANDPRTGILMTRSELKRAIGRVVLDRGPNAIVVMDPAGRVRYVNTQFTTISGWAEGEVEGHSIGKLLWNRGAQLKEIWSRVGAGMEWHGELYERTRGGKQYREYASIAPVKGAGGRTVLLLMVSTARNQAEKETRSRFEHITDMSSELRPPIHAIIGNTELLSETALNEEQKDYTDTVRSSADILLTLINDVLDFSKIESGRLELKKIPFDVYEVVEEAVGLVALQAHMKGLEIITRFASGLPHLVAGDPLRLRQILVNLLSNAVKFTRTGEVEISVAPEALERVDVILRCSVRDTGIGIPRGVQEDLFKAIGQLNVPTTGTPGGTGLGLAISRRLAGLMGGTMGVESSEGKGSTFWFTVRLARQETSDRYAAVAPDFFGGARVLIVDDNQTARSVLRDYLDSWGCRTSETSEGRQALSILKAAADSYDPFAISLIDLRMPGIDGWQLASEVVSDPAVKATRLALMTPFGYGAQEAKMKLLKWFGAYLTKPVRKMELFETIFRFLNSGADLEAARVGAKGSVGSRQRWLKGPAGSVAPRSSIAAAEEPSREGQSDGVFDYQSALLAFMGEKETLKQVAAAFLSRAREKLPAMEKDLKEGQWGPLGFDAHGIKGGALGVSAAQLADAADRLERAAGGRDREGGERAFRDYRAALARFERRVHRI